MREPGLRLLAFAPAAALFACFTTQNDDRSAGVDDFPNTIHARVSGLFGEAQSGALPLTPEVQNLTGGVPYREPSAAGRPSALAKSAGDTALFVDSSTKNLGYVTVRFVVIEPDQIVYDTAVIRYDAQYADGIRDNENMLRGIHTVVSTAGGIDRIEVTDADGDGLINPLPGGNSRNRLRFTKIDSGMTQHAELVMSPGADNDFDSVSDNALYLARWWKLRGPDTLAVAEYFDADADGIVVNNAGTSVAILDFREWNPVGKPGTAESHLRIRTRLRYQVAGEILGISGEENLRSGGLHRFGLFNEQGGPDIDIGGVVLGRFVQKGGPADTLDSLAVELRLTLGGTFEDSIDDRVHALSLTVAKRLGPEANSTLRFVSFQPMLPDSKPQDGIVTMRMEDRDGGVLLLEGIFTAGALKADITIPGGKMFHAEWDAAGNLLSVVAL